MWITTKEDINYLSDWLDRKPAIECSAKKELIGFVAHFKQEVLEEVRKDKSRHLHNVFDCVFAGKDPSSVDWEGSPYKVNDYLWLDQALSNTIHFFFTDGLFTRKAIIVCPEWHCFTSIQFLIRVDPGDVTKHYLQIIFNIRSCNFDKNFVDDAVFVYKMGIVALSRIEDKLRRNHVLDFEKIKDVRLQMNVGSLHRF